MDFQKKRVHYIQANEVITRSESGMWVVGRLWIHYCSQLAMYFVVLTKHSHENQIMFLLCLF